MSRSNFSRLLSRSLSRSVAVWATVLFVSGSASVSLAQSGGSVPAQSVSRKVLARRTSQSVEQPSVAATTQVVQQPQHDTVGHRHCCNRPEVYLLRGGAGYWPRVEEFGDTLRARGFEPTVIPHWEHRGLADAITRAYYNNELAGPINIIGYSSGADAACWMSERLNKAGVPVTNLILIESTIGVAVPTNVSFCYNIYESRWADAVPAFRGIAVKKKNPNTELYNVDVRQFPELTYFAERNHFTMASSRNMHNYLTEILASRVFQPAAAPQLPAESELEDGNFGGAPEAAVSRDIREDSVVK
ncbi:MAG: hypothetical protein JSS02_06670 [Planctomycetes bacterium]|nr:hypothetical protein [Planctomycetota bacterium]